MAIELSEQEQLRRQSLTALRNLGIEPYPAARYEVTATAREIAENFDETKGNYGDVRIAGRIMTRRIMGSASFFELQDHTGRIQVYIRRDDICPEGDPTLYNTVFKKLLDIGDFIGVEGFAFHTNTGELSVHCRKFTVLSKSIRPLPVVKEKDGKTLDAFGDDEHVVVHHPEPLSAQVVGAFSAGGEAACTAAVFELRGVDDTVGAALRVGLLGVDAPQVGHALVECGAHGLGLARILVIDNHDAPGRGSELGHRVEQVGQEFLALIGDDNDGEFVDGSGEG